MLATTILTVSPFIEFLDAKCDGSVCGKASPKPLMPSQMQGDGVIRRLDGVSLCQSKEALGRFGGMTASQNPSDAVRAQFL
ncbi:hypothetical protein Tco_0802001 [Tanacetum coccineum]|uniref:Uncharacterized protein n=1 Tax=Tanacetum coccineum TaxID=301880 RepID=A0ABQ5A1V1_9ASTR